MIDALIAPPSVFWALDFGHLLTLLGLGIMVWLSNRQRRHDAQKLHIDNLERLVRIEESLKGLSHLDECLDDLRKQFYQLINNRR